MRQLATDEFRALLADHEPPCISGAEKRGGSRFVSLCRESGHETETKQKRLLNPFPLQAKPKEGQDE